MEMPDVIYVFPDPKSIGDMGFTVTNPDSTCSGVPYVQYHHSRIMEALQEENKRLRENLKELAIVVRCQWDDEDQLDAGRDLAKRILEEKWPRPSLYIPIITEAVSAISANMRR